MVDPLRGKSWAEIKEAVARGEVRLPTSEELMSDLIIYSEASSFSEKMFKIFRTFEENRIRECLMQWVSELEPTLIYQGGAFVGLGLDGDLSDYPKVYIKASDPRFIAWRTRDSLDIQI